MPPPKHSIAKILTLLNAAYGRRPAFRRTDPVDELVRTILSQNTSDRNSLPAFAALKRKFRTWERVSVASPAAIVVPIRHAGLARLKAARIKEVLAEIKRREGRMTLSRLDRMSTTEAAGYLRSLKGVGPKTAACVLLFSFAKPVMPVDTHIFRVAGRLGLIGRAVAIEEAHTVLTAMVPKGLHYDFHLGIIEHGRKTCKAQNPHCGSCVLYGQCAFRGKERSA